jgi:hypothetical protein
VLEFSVLRIILQFLALLGPLVFAYQTLWFDEPSKDQILSGISCLKQNHMVAFMYFPVFHFDEHDKNSRKKEQGICSFSRDSVFVLFIRSTHFIIL